MNEPTLKSYIVWRDRHSDARISTSHIETKEWDECCRTMKRETLLGAACIIKRLPDAEKAEEIAAKESFWNPAPKAERPHFVVWRTMYRGGRASMYSVPGHDWDTIERGGTDSWEGGACVLECVETETQAEEIGKGDSFWEPVDPEEIDRIQRMFAQLKQEARNHYPEAW